MKERKYFIYGLMDSKDVVFYVGKSVEPYKRYKEHINEATKKQHHNKNTHKINKINNLLRNGEPIKLLLIEQVTKDTWEEKEIYWIEFYQKINTKLTNAKSGGKGGREITYKISYNECKKIVSENIPHIKTQPMWGKAILDGLIPEGVPKSPNTVFKYNGWISWSDFLDNPQNKKKQYLSYDDAKNWMKKNKPSITIHADFLREIKINNSIPSYIPHTPQKVYENKGWISWSAFLDNTRKYVSKFYAKKSTYTKYKSFLSYIECKNWVSENLSHINNRHKWRKYLKEYTLPPFIPHTPDGVYLNCGWSGWINFLNSDYHNNPINYVSYEDAKKLIQIKFQNINTITAYKKVINDLKIKELPVNPQKIYKNDNWLGWGDFLGCNIISAKNRGKSIISYDEFIYWMAKNKPNINSSYKYIQYCKEEEFPIFLPKSPRQVYNKPAKVLYKTIKDIVNSII